MKKLLSILLMVLLVLFIAVPAFTQVRYGLVASDAIETTTALVAPAGSWVYGVKIYADENTSVLSIHDCATTAAITMTNIIAEVGEAVAYDTQQVWFIIPIYAANGVSMMITTGVGFVYTGPNPKD